MLKISTASSIIALVAPWWLQLLLVSLHRLYSNYLFVFEDVLSLQLSPKYQSGLLIRSLITNRWLVDDGCWLVVQLVAGTLGV